MMVHGCRFVSEHLQVCEGERWVFEDSSSFRRVPLGGLSQATAYAGEGTLKKGPEERMWLEDRLGRVIR